MAGPAPSRLVLATGAAAGVLVGAALVGDGLATDGAARPGVAAPPTPVATTDEPRRSPYDAAIAELDCAPGDHTVWMTDSAEPPPGIDVDEALTRYVAAWDGRREDERRGGRGAFAVVLARGRVVEVVHLERWPNGSWSVEGGQRCRSGART